MRARLPADKLERLSDGHHVVHAGSNRQGLNLMAAALAAYRRNNGALGAARHVGLESGFADALNNVVDLLFCGAVRHVYDHGDDLFFFSAAKDKGLRFLAALAESLMCLVYFVDWLRSCTSAANENQ